MLYVIVEPFGPGNGQKWKDYLTWRDLPFERFDSVDGILRPTVYGSPETEEDWQHAPDGDFSLHLVTDLAFARRKREELGRGEVVGLCFEAHEETHPGFLGFDILDGNNAISLLTNFGNDLAYVNEAVSPNGLIRSRERAEAVHRQIKREFPTDAHVEGSRLVSVYRVQS